MGAGVGQPDAFAQARVEHGLVVPAGDLGAERFDAYGVSRRCSSSPRGVRPVVHRTRAPAQRLGGEGKQCLVSDAEIGQGLGVGDVERVVEESPVLRSLGVKVGV